jgi:hypothetical protein
MQYSPVNPGGSAKQHQARPDRVANGLGVTNYLLRNANRLKSLVGAQGLVCQWFIDEM